MPLIQANINDQYKKHKELKREDVVHLLEWLEKQPHLPTTSELQMLLFYHANKFSIESTKKCLENFFTLRLHCNEFFENYDPRSETLMTTLKSMATIALPKLTPDGHLVFYVRLIDPNPKFFNFDSIMTIFEMVGSLYSLKFGLVGGQVVILDLFEGALSHLFKINVSSLRKALEYMQEALPLNLSSVHFVNQVSFMHTMMSFVKPFVKKEIYDLMHFHDSFDGLYKFVPQDILPKEIGGFGESVLDLQREIIEVLLDNTELLQQISKLKADESKRPGKLENTCNLFGVEGAFKKLEFD